MNDTTNTKKPSETNKPIHKIRVGSISVSIWENAFDKGKPTYRAAWPRRTGTTRAIGRRRERFEPTTSSWSPRWPSSPRTGCLTARTSHRW